jgi:hypothetical protein
MVTLNNIGRIAGFHGDSYRDVGIAFGHMQDATKDNRVGILSSTIRTLKSVRLIPQIFSVSGAKKYHDRQTLHRTARSQGDLHRHYEELTRSLQQL